MANSTKVRRGAVFILRAKHGRDGLLKAVSFVTLVRTKKVETQQKCEAGGSPVNFGAYPLCLIHSRKGNWLHVGSTPTTPTIKVLNLVYIMLAYKDIDVLTPCYFIDTKKIYMDIVVIDEKNTEFSEDYNGREISVTTMKFTGSDDKKYEFNEAEDSGHILFFKLEHLDEALALMKKIAKDRLEELETEKEHIEAILSYIDKKVLISV